MNFSDMTPKQLTEKTINDIAKKENRRRKQKELQLIIAWIIGKR